MNTHTLTTILLQTQAHPNEVERNIRLAQSLVDANPGADLYILPEMWATGFETSPTTATGRASALAKKWMEDTALKNHCAIMGSLAVPAENNEQTWHNRLYFITPGGVAAHYDKRHVFRPGLEGRHYKAGNSRVIVCWRGWRILLQVCYDLRFPVFSRNRNDYDLAVYVAAWPASRGEVWNTLLRARAIENQCYVCGVNLTGTDATGYPNAGHSAAIHAKGTPRSLGDEVGALRAELDLDELRRFREKFNVLADADDFRLTPYTPA